MAITMMPNGNHQVHQNTDNANIIAYLHLSFGMLASRSRIPNDNYYKKSQDECKMQLCLCLIN